MNNTSKKRVLVIEDEQTLRSAIVKKLEKSGFDVQAVSSGEEGLDLVKDPNNKPDIIWLDYYLPTMNGLDFLTEVKKKENLKDIPVFVISNTAGPEKVASMMALGVSKYFVKAEKRLDEIIEEMNKLL